MINKENFRNNFQYFDKSVVLQVLDIFLSEYQDRFNELEKNVSELDFKAIDNNAHSFKSNVAYMSEELHELARILEFKGKEQDSSDLRESFDNLKSATLLIIDDVIELRKEYGG